MRSILHKLGPFDCNAFVDNDTFSILYCLEKLWMQNVDVNCMFNVNVNKSSSFYVFKIELLHYPKLLLSKSL